MACNLSCLVGYRQRNWKFLAAAGLIAVLPLPTASLSETKYEVLGPLTSSDLIMYFVIASHAPSQGAGNRRLK